MVRWSTQTLILLRKLVKFSCQGNEALMDARCLSSVPAGCTRVRFAPSPTGEIHLGGLRTALYNYLFAHKVGGTFILRVEDTDQTRLVPGSMEKMLEILSWMGLTPDEGPGIGGHHGPYIQSQRKELYAQHAELLIKNGEAYRCFCSAERLELLRKEQMRRRENIGYDNLCRNLPQKKIDDNIKASVPHVIRFKLKSFDEPRSDIVYGKITSDVEQFEGDPVILKSDGFPTYHLANVVDDHFMEISHVLRGVEWQSSTSKHLMLFKAFGWAPPAYAHLPLLLNADGTKLSKRQDALRLQSLKDKGYHPNSIISLLCLSGGGVNIHHSDITSKGVDLQIATENFSLENIKTQSTVLPIDRLGALNRKCLLQLYKMESEQAFTERILQLLSRADPCLSDYHKRTAQILWQNFEKYAERIETMHDFLTGDFKFLWSIPSLPISHLSALGKGSDVQSLLMFLVSEIESSSALLDLLRTETWKRAGVTKTLFFKVARMVLTGQQTGPPVAMIFELLEKSEALRRCQLALNTMLGQIDDSQKC